MWNRNDSGSGRGRDRKKRKRRKDRRRMAATVGAVSTAAVGLGGAGYLLNRKRMNSVVVSSKVVPGKNLTPNPPVTPRPADLIKPNPPKARVTKPLRPIPPKTDASQVIRGNPAGNSKVVASSVGPKQTGAVEVLGSGSRGYRKQIEDSIRNMKSAEVAGGSIVASPPNPLVNNQVSVATDGSNFAVTYLRNAGRKMNDSMQSAVSNYVDAPNATRYSELARGQSIRNTRNVTRRAVSDSQKVYRGAQKIKKRASDDIELVRNYFRNR